MQDPLLPFGTSDRDPHFDLPSVGDDSDFYDEREGDETELRGEGWPRDAREAAAPIPEELWGRWV